MDDGPLEYVRSAIPEAVLVDTDGSNVPLTRLTKQHAALLILPGSAGDQRGSTLRAIAGWPQQMPLVDFVLVVTDARAERDDLAPYADRVLGDPQEKVQALFSPTGVPAAVLLGTDGLLAGGPVHGLDAVAQFVADIAAALEGPADVPTDRRAIVTFVEGDGPLMQQLLALRLSLLALPGDDTDLVVMGPDDVLRRLPDDLVKIPQRPACDDPVWRGYRYINSIACLNGAGSEQLQEYTHLLRTDVDTLLFPGWDEFRPVGFRWGKGGYAGVPEVHEKLAAVADLYGLTHRGVTPIGSTWYGPTDIVRRAAALTEMLTKHLVANEFAKDPGAWPGWYRGVSSMYAGEIAVNHLVADGALFPELDSDSTSMAPAQDTVHVHCWHTDNPFSKRHFTKGRYTPDDVDKLPQGSVARRCLELAFDSLADMARFRTGRESPRPSSGRRAES